MTPDHPDFEKLTRKARAVIYLTQCDWTLDAIADELNVSLTTARRWTNPAYAARQKTARKVSDLPPAERTPYKHFAPHSIPAKCHPLVRRLLEEMNEQRVTLSAMGDKTGIATKTFACWKRGGSATIATLDRCFAVVGLSLSVRQANRS